MSLRAVAHRGYSARFPENSLAAFDAAIAIGAAVIETDVRASADGVLVCLHDPDLRRLAGHPESVAGTTLAELRRILGDGRPCRLEEVLDLAHGHSEVLLDMKLADAEVTGRTLAALRDARMLADTHVGVRTLGHAALVRSLEPTALMVGLLGSYTDFPAFFAAGGTISRVWECDLTTPLAKTLTAGGHPFWVMAGAPRQGLGGETNSAGIARMRAFGAAAVLLNDPSILTMDKGQ